MAIPSSASSARVAGATLSDRLNPTHPAFDGALKAMWATLTRSQKKAYVETDMAALQARKDRVAAIVHPFEAVDDDHAETSPEAYADVAPLLCALQSQAASSKLRIYDPYFCSGAVKAHLAAVGFPDVYNECEDWYVRMRAGTIPPHDVLVTNPAYSGDHIPSLLRYVVDSKRPFLLLMPTYVVGKEYYHEIVMAAGVAMSYLVPAMRYVYWTPPGLRERKQAHSSALGVRTSPFISMWYVHLGPRKVHNAIVAPLSLREGCTLYHSVAALPRAVVAGLGEVASMKRRDEDRGASGTKRRRDAPAAESATAADARRRHDATGALKKARVIPGV